MSQRVAWNGNNSIKCLGISWASDQYGLSRPSGSGNRYFYWDVPQSTTIEIQDSGQLLISAKAVFNDGD
jgi:hypothetical protein